MLIEMFARDRVRDESKARKSRKADRRLTISEPTGSRIDGMVCIALDKIAQENRRMTWRPVKRVVDQPIREGGGGPNSIELNHIDFGKGATPASIRCDIGVRKDRLQIWDVMATAK